jgi:hypothetical protein
MAGVFDHDSVTLAAGDENHTNVLLQTVDPFNPNSNNTHIEGDGQRIFPFGGVRTAPTSNAVIVQIVGRAARK